MRPFRDAILYRWPDMDLAETYRRDGLRCVSCEIKPNGVLLAGFASGVVASWLAGRINRAPECRGCVRRRHDYWKETRADGTITAGGELEIGAPFEMMR